MPLSAIGAQTFLTMTPQPQTAGMRLQPETKAGVNGVGFWQLGVHGQEYQIDTQQIAATFAVAVTAEATYRAYISAGPVTVVYGGQTIGSAIVVDVTTSAERVLGAYGDGIAGQALVKAQWRLIPV